MVMFHPVDPEGVPRNICSNRQARTYLEIDDLGCTRTKLKKGIASKYQNEMKFY